METEVIVMILVAVGISRNLNIEPVLVQCVYIDNHVCSYIYEYYMPLYSCL